MKSILLIMIGLSSLLSADFTRDSATGIVTDNTTGLIWQDDAIGGYTTWQDAIDRCEALTLGGYSDWRVPNINELKSIVDRSKSNSGIVDGFTNIGSSYYWSSTTYVDNEYNAWGVYFSRGGVVNLNDKSYNYYVRCVRAGQ